MSSQAAYVGVPGAGRIHLPTDMGRLAHHAMALWSPCRPRALLARRAVSVVLKSVGPKVIPGPRHHLDALGDAEPWSAIIDAATRTVGQSRLAIYRPPQHDRLGCAVLMIGPDGAVGFLKIRPREDGGLAKEIEALAALGGSGGGLWIPELLQEGTRGPWRYALTSPIPTSMHVPSSGEALDSMMDNVYRRIIGVLGDPPVRGYEPMHGDLTPWNVRGLRDGRTAVFDWESAGWGPPGADHAYFWASAVAVGLSRQPVSASPEIVAFWTDRLAARNTDSPREARLAARLLRAMSNG